MDMPSLIVVQQVSDSPLSKNIQSMSDYDARYVGHTARFPTALPGHSSMTPNYDPCPVNKLVPAPITARFYSSAFYVVTSLIPYKEVAYYNTINDRYGNCRALTPIGTSFTGEKFNPLVNTIYHYKTCCYVQSKDIFLNEMPIKDSSSSLDNFI